MPSVKQRRLRLLWISCAILGAGLLIYILARAGLPVPCLFHRLTGLQCPGCGSTRAVLALLRLDISAAVSYNLMFPLTALYLIFVYLRCAAACLKTGRFSYRSPAPAIDCMFLGLLLLWWVIRNILHI